MSSKILGWLAVLAFQFVVAGAAPASETAPGTPEAARVSGLDLVESSSCMACHRVRGRRVGPAFALIAQRFAGQSGAADYLAHTIRSGGRGRWGAIPMPAQPQVSPSQASAIAAWILSLADDSGASPGAHAKQAAGQ